MRIALSVRLRQVGWAPLLVAVCCMGWSPLVAQAASTTRSTSTDLQGGLDSTPLPAVPAAGDPFSASQNRTNQDSAPSGPMRAGLRQELRNRSLDADPLGRLNNRLANRVRNRIDNRIERSNEFSRDPATAVESAEQRTQSAAPR